MRHSPKSGSDATFAALRLGCVIGAMPGAWTAALHGPRCCTQRPRAGDRLDAGHKASGDAVQEGAPGGAVSVDTVQRKSHLLHGSGIALKGDRFRHQSGGVMRPPALGSHREQGHAASFRAGERHRRAAVDAIARWQIARAARRVLAAVSHVPRCCTQRPRAGRRLDADDSARGSVVQEGALEDAVGAGTVHAHLLHGSGISTTGHCRHRQSGAVMRPPGFGLNHEQSHVASFRVGERRRDVAVGAIAHQQKKRITHSPPGAEARTRVARGNAWCRQDADQGTLRKRRQSSTKFYWGISANCGEMLSEGREARPFANGWP